MIDIHIRTGYMVCMCLTMACLLHSKYVCHCNTLRVWVEETKKTGEYKTLSMNVKNIVIWKDLLACFRVWEIDVRE